ncbi:hypothetical protein Gotur_035358 [Gossypium turneri]
MNLGKGLNQCSGLGYWWSVNLSEDWGNSRNPVRIPKSSPKSQNGSAKISSLGYEAQKGNRTLAIVRAGGGSQSGHGIDELKLKSLGKKPMHDFGLNVPLVVPLSKPNPAFPYLQVCPTEAGQPNTCVPLKLEVQVALVPLADSIKEVVKLISSELTNEVEMGV